MLTGLRIVTPNNKLRKFSQLLEGYYSTFKLLKLLISDKYFFFMKEFFFFALI